MIQLLQFRADYELDLQITGTPRVERVKVQAGDVIEAQVRPYIRLTDKGLIECADLLLGDEGVLRCVWMAAFQFV